MAIFNSYFDITIISMAMLLMGKSIISMAIFNSYVTNYQRVTSLTEHFYLAWIAVSQVTGKRLQFANWKITNI